MLHCSASLIPPASNTLLPYWDFAGKKPVCRWWLFPIQRDSQFVWHLKRQFADKTREEAEEQVQKMLAGTSKAMDGLR